VAPWLQLRTSKAEISRIGVGEALAWSLRSRFRLVWFAAAWLAVWRTSTTPFQASDARSARAVLKSRSLSV
jgi:hypothetical protein